MSKNTEVLVSREYRAMGGKLGRDQRHISVSAKCRKRVGEIAATHNVSMARVVEALTDERALEAFAARLRAGEAA